MENASKALLIAGGVLIAMLVLSLGVYFSKHMAEQNARIYRQLEQSEKTEFNEQFTRIATQSRQKSDGTYEFTAYSINIQDIVTLINLARDSNIRNGIQNITPPSNPTNNDSLYIRVDASVIDSLWANAEKKTDTEVNEFLNDKILINNLYSCTIDINSNTGYVSYIKIN